MKITTIFLMLNLVNLSANVYSQSQKFSFSYEKIQIKDLLQQIENKSTYKFLYRPDLLDNYFVKLNATDKTLEELLSAALNKSDISFRILEDNLVVITSKDYLKQDQKVTGTITDSSTGEPIIGANVIIEGTTIGVTTDTNGAFSITVPTPNAVIVVSSIGYVTEKIATSGRAVIDIKLVPDITKLEEVVVVGYGTMKRSDITGSVVSVGEDKIKSTVSTSLDQALQGRAAGVQVFNNSGQPGGGVSIRIRGANSINGTNEPLYVIDGIPVSGGSVGTAVGFNFGGGGNGQTAISGLSSISPSDIVSMEILKDASATAIYGSRGANGVIVITTRRGQSGETKVNYDGYYGLQQLPKYLDVLNLKEYAAYQNEVAKELGETPREEFQDLSILGKGTDWQNEIFRTAPTVSHQIALSGGNERTQYALSLGYLSQDGIVIGSHFNRYSLRLNVDNQARKWLKVGNSIGVSRTSERITLNDDNSGVIMNALRQNPDIPVRMPDGSFGGPSDSEYAISNPVALALSKDLNVNRLVVTGNLYADVNLYKGLTFRSEIGTDLRYNNNYAFNPTYQWGTVGNQINQSVRAINTNIFWIVKNYVTYKRNFGSASSLQFMVGQEAQKFTGEYLSGSRKGFVTNYIQELNAGTALSASNTGSKGSNALESYYSRVNFSIAEKYLFTGTIRADGSSKFGPSNKWGYFPSFALGWNISKEDFMRSFQQISNLKIRAGYGHTGNQDIGNYAYGIRMTNYETKWGSGILPSNIANPKVKWETTVSKNIGLDLAMFRNRIELIVDVYDKQTKDLLMVKPLPLYMGTTGNGSITSPYVNIGKLQNRGVELTLNTVNTQGKVNWSSNFTFSLNRNKVLALANQNAVIDQNVQWFDLATRTKVGQPIGQYFGYVTEGIFKDEADIRNHAIQVSTTNQNGNIVHKIDRIAGTWVGDVKFKDISGPNGTPDGIIDQYDRTFIGNPEPKFTYGLGNSLTFNNFDFNLFLTGMYGNKLMNYNRVLTEALDANFNQMSTVSERARIVLINSSGSFNDISNVRLSNPGTDMPRVSRTDPNDNNRISDRYIEDGSFLRIKSLSVGYTLPKTMIDKVNLSKVRIYFTAQNVYTFTKYTGYDPEIGAYDQSVLLTGVDNGHYPSPRIYTFGLNVEF